MATNTNGIATFWDLASWWTDNSQSGESGDEEVILSALQGIFGSLGRELPSSVEEGKQMGQECPTKQEIETFAADVTNANISINNASTYTSTQLVKYSDLSYESADTIIVTPSSLSFTPIPSIITGSTNLTVESSGNWTGVSNTGIGTITPSSGVAGTTAVLFNPGRNASTSSRNGTLTFTCGNTSDTVTWTQNGTAASQISISPTSGRFDYNDAMGVTVTVTCAGRWSASSSTSWLRVSPTWGTGNASVHITVYTNASSSTRRGTVTFKYNNDTAVFTAFQMGRV